jgi:hypothetical protein
MGYSNRFGWAEAHFYLFNYTDLKVGAINCLDTNCHDLQIVDKKIFERMGFSPTKNNQ